MPTMQHADLPLDVRLMTTVTRGLVLVFVVLCLGVVTVWLTRHNVWTLKEIRVQGDVEHQSGVELRAQLVAPLRKLDSSFLTTDLQQVRELFETMPWVRRAQVHREFPNRLRVTLEEHEAVAWWGQSGSGQLVSRLGDVFEANPDDADGLPELAGPVDQSAQVLGLFKTLSSELSTLQLGLVRLELDERGSWRAELDSGTRLELGRGSPEDLIERAKRFTTTLGQLQQRYPGALQTVDLRYPNGYALRIQGVTTVTEDSGNNPTPTR